MPFPSGHVLGIARENVVEVPASWLVLVISRRTVQSTGPGGGLRKAKFISALASSHHHRQFTSRYWPFFLSSTPVAHTQSCRPWAFPVQFSLLSIFSSFCKASSSITTFLKPLPLAPSHHHTIPRPSDSRVEFGLSDFFFHFSLSVSTLKK